MQFILYSPISQICLRELYNLYTHDIPVPGPHIGSEKNPAFRTVTVSSPLPRRRSSTEDRARSRIPWTRPVWPSHRSRCCCARRRPGTPPLASGNLPHRCWNTAEHTERRWGWCIRTHGDTTPTLCIKGLLWITKHRWIFGLHAYVFGEHRCETTKIKIPWNNNLSVIYDLLILYHWSVLLSHNVWHLSEFYLPSGATGCGCKLRNTRLSTNML